MLGSGSISLTKIVMADNLTELTQMALQQPVTNHNTIALNFTRIRLCRVEKQKLPAYRFLPLVLSPSFKGVITPLQIVCTVLWHDVTASSKCSIYDPTHVSEP